MNVLSTIVEHEGISIKVEKGRVFLRAFGTTFYNKSPHWSWMEVKINDLKPEVKQLLKERGLI